MYLNIINILIIFKFKRHNFSLEKKVFVFPPEATRGRKIFLILLLCLFKANLNEPDGIIVETGSGSVLKDWLGRWEARSLPGWAAGDAPSSMLRCPSGSLRSEQVPLEWEIELCVISIAMIGGAYMMGPSDVVYIEKRRGPSTEPWGTPVTSWCDLDASPLQETLQNLSVR